MLVVIVIIGVIMPSMISMLMAPPTLTPSCSVIVLLCSPGPSGLGIFFLRENGQSQRVVQSGELPGRGFVGHLDPQRERLVVPLVPSKEVGPQFLGVALLKC